jgi:hypothetical protein
MSEKPCACGRTGCLIRRVPGQTDEMWSRQQFFSPACMRAAPAARHKRGLREPPMTADELRAVRGMLAEGLTFREIGDALNRDHSGVAKQAKRNGWRSVRLAHGRHPTLMELQS